MSKLYHIWCPVQTGRHKVGKTCLCHFKSVVWSYSCRSKIALGFGISNFCHALIWYKDTKIGLTAYVSCGRWTNHPPAWLCQVWGIHNFWWYSQNRLHSVCSPLFFFSPSRPWKFFSIHQSYNTLKVLLPFIFNTFWYFSEVPFDVASFDTTIELSWTLNSCFCGLLGDILDLFISSLSNHQFWKYKVIVTFVTHYGFCSYLKLIW